MATVEELYKHFGELADAKDKAGEHQSAYLAILTGTKGGSNEKRLSSQFIARFSKYFPDIANQSLDAMFDLCEDEDVNIRKQAVKDLPNVCKDDQGMLSKVADVLVQLLQTDDPLELSLVQMSLVTLLKTDAKGALGGLFSQVLSGEELVRQRAIKFMGAKLKALPQDVWTDKLEAFFIEETKKVFVDCTGDEFVALMKILAGMKHMQTLQGRMQLLEMVAQQADMDSDFDPADQEGLDRLTQCLRLALNYFSKNVHSTRFVSYICDQVLPMLPLLTNESSDGDDTQLDILKLLAELSAFCGPLENAKKHLETLHKCLLEYMPLPPATTEIETEKTIPELNFSYVECLMYSFHQMARHCPGFLTDEGSADRLKDFRTRLQYFARGVQLYIKQLRLMLQNKTGDDLKEEENKIRVLALKTTNNINLLIKDLFHNPPAYKAEIVLSWKPVPKVGSEAGATAGSKRSMSDDSGGGASKEKREFKGPKGVYQPPTGKYSERAGTYQPSFGRGRGRGFRGGRRW